MVDNTIKIRELLQREFESKKDISFHLQILQRSKDGHEVANRLVAEWFITSLNRFDFIQDAVKLLCNAYNARAYINLNPKANEAVAWKMVENLMGSIKTKSISPFKIVGSAHDSCSGHGSKYWVIDIDDPFIDMEALITQIQVARPNDTEKIVMRLPTKNGQHLITRPFDLSAVKLPTMVEIKKNNATVLYGK